MLDRGFLGNPHEPEGGSTTPNNGKPLRTPRTQSEHKELDMRAFSGCGQGTGAVCGTTAPVGPVRGPCGARVFCGSSFGLSR